MTTPTIFAVLLDGTVTPTPSEYDAPRIARCVIHACGFNNQDRQLVLAVPVKDGRIAVQEVASDGELRGVFYVCPSTFNRTDTDLAIVTESWRRACVRARDEQIASLSRPMPWESIKDEPSAELGLEPFKAEVERLRRNK